MNRADLLAEIAVYVGELTKPIHHAAEYERRDDRSHRVKRHLHWTLQPSLLDQLRAQMHSAPAGDDEASRRPPSSRPPLHTDSLDALLRIEAFSACLLSGYGRPLRATVEANLRGLVGVATELDDEPLRALAKEVEYWHGWARTVTAWVSPAWRPLAPCPLCERRDGLRVRLETHSAVCVHCGGRWDRVNLGLLAEHVRAWAAGEVEEVAG